MRWVVLNIRDIELADSNAQVKREKWDKKARSLSELWRFGEEEEEDKPTITTISPAGSLWDIGKAVAGSDIPGRIYESIPEPIIQGSKVVGSKVMDFIAPIDKPRGAGAGLWDVLGEYGDKIIRDKATGEYKIVEQERSVLDDEPLIDRLIQGAKEGWEDPASKSFGDEFTSLYPDWLSKITGTEFAGDVTANIGGDILTYTPARWLTIPYRLITSALKKPATAIAKVGPVRSILEAFNVHVGDAAEAKKILDDLRLEQRGEDILADRERIELEDKLAGIAIKAGVSVEELKTALTQSIETGDVGLVAKHGADAVKFADDEVKFYQDILKAEQAAGRTTEDILARAGELGISGYMPHIPGRQFDRTFNKKIERLLSKKISPEYRRELEGTIREINERMGRQFFLDDPLILHAMRRRWSNQAIAADRMFNKAKTHGVEINPKKPGFDIDGNPIPKEWLKLKGHAFPADFHRIISKQDEILSNPAKMKAYLKFYDSVQTWWKKYTLGLRPAWHTRNAFGNVWNAYLIGGLTDPLRYGQAAAVQKAMQVGKGRVVGQTDLILGKVTGKTVDPKAIVPGTGMTREELFDEAVRRGVYESGMYGQDIGEAALRQSNIPGHTEWSGINKAFAAGKTVENNARLALFIDGIAKGIKSASRGGPVDAERILDSAALNVRRSLFDYSDLSNFEKTVMKRAAPFYTWTRKNLPAQLMAIAEHPDRANKLNILIAGAQRDVGKIDSNDVEEWVKNQFPIFLPAQDSEDTYTFMTAMSYLPTAELNRIFQNPRDLLDMLGQMGSPLLKLPFELITNYDTFRHKAIDPSQKGMGIGKFGEGFFVNPSKGSQDFLGLSVTPKQRHLLQSLVLLGEVDRLNPFNIFGDREEGTKSWAGAPRHGRDILESSRWIRAGLGVRIYKRGRGQARMRKTFDLISDIKYLERKLKEPQTIMNEALKQHLLRQMREIQRGEGD